MKKKAFLTVLCALLLVVASVLGTVAYLTDTDSVQNVFTVGKVGISLDETNADGDIPEGAAAAPERDQANDYHLIPGATFVKDPTVHIDAGSESAYVRMYLTINMSEEWDKICAQYKKLDSSGNPTTENLFGIMDILTGYQATEWLYQGNTEDLAGDNTRTYEFWYKTATTKSADSQDLTPLFTGIAVPKELTNDDLALLGDQFRIYVVAQAMQAAGFEDNMAGAFGAIPGITGAALIPNP